MKTRMMVVAMVAMCVVAWAGPSWAGWVDVDFETGKTHDQEEIGTLIPGLNFTTATGGSWFFGYIGSYSPSGIYNYAWKSDNGKQDAYWDYFMSDDVAAYVMNLDDVGVISLTSGTADAVRVGYSIGREYSFTLEAYDAAGHMLGIPSVGGPNCREEPQGSGEGGLAYLTVAAPGISYVKLYGDPESGGWWIVDNVSYEPSDSRAVPEWPTLVLALSGLAPVILRRRSSCSRAIRG